MGACETRRLIGDRKMKKTIVLAVVIVLAGFVLSIHLASAEEFSQDAAKKAKEIHELASSDVIYVQDELKALYYQNLQIIELLKEIRQVLDLKLENTKK